MESPDVLRVVYTWSRDRTPLVSLHAPSLAESLAATTGPRGPDPTVDQRLLLPRQRSFGVASVRWHEDAIGLIIRLVARLPVWTLDTDEGPTPLAVLVSGVPAGGVDLEEVTRALLRTVGVSDERFVLATDTESTDEVPGFELPFVIAYAGAGSRRLPRAIDAIVPSRPEPVAPHAFTHRWLGSGGSIWDQGIDILVTTAERVQRDLQRGARKVGPRLIVAFARTARMPQLHPGTIPSTTSILVVGRDTVASADQLMPTLVRSLAHDQPLHAVVWSTVYSSGSAERRAAFRLYTAAPLLNSLRLTSAFEHVRARLEELRLHGAAPQLDVPAAVSERFGVSTANWDVIRSAMVAGDQLRPDFRRESWGLTDVAKTNAKMGAAAAEVVRLQQAGSRLERDATLLSDLEREHARRFAVRVRDAGPAGPGPDGGVLPAGAHLRPSHRYEVDAAVGVTWDHDLVAEDTPAIDALLPPVERHRALHVTIYADGAQIVGDAVRQLELPPVGPSTVVTFTVRTRADPGPVRLRLTVHYHGHLLQMHKVEATVEPADDQPERGLHAAQVFSRNDALTLLEEVPERALTIIANADAGGATHSIQAFSEGVASHARFSEATVAQWQKGIRGELASTFDLFHAGRLTPQRFAEGLRELAYRGRELWRDGLKNAASGAMTAQLKHIQSVDRATIQVFRLQPELAIQWWLLYDWTLPTTLDERRAATVCLGVAPGGASCGHATNPPRTICVRGFWGIRHLVEEFVVFDGDTTTRSAIAQSPAAPADGPVILCAIADRQPSPQRALDALRTIFGVGDPDVDIELVKDATSMDSLLDLLSDDARRPAAVVIIGHLTVEKISSEPDGPRVHLPTSERFLHAESFPDFEEWSDPHRPVIFLLVCEAGADEVGKLPSFVRDLTNRGAAAVVTAETEIDVRMAVDLVTDLVPMLPTTDLGEAVRKWRHNCLVKTDPSGLLFNAFGNSGVRLPTTAPPR